MSARSSNALTTQARRPFWQVSFLALLPSVTLVFALVFGAVPLASIAWAMMVPDFLAPILFFWCVHRPRTVPILFVFCLGIAADIMHSSPLGSHTLSYMLMAIGAKILGPQLTNLGLLFNWGAFSVLMLIFATIKLAASMLGTPGVVGLPTVPSILQSAQLVLTTIIAYPVLHVPFAALYESLSETRELG